MDLESEQGEESSDTEEGTEQITNTIRSAYNCY